MNNININKNSTQSGRKERPEGSADTKLFFDDVYKSGTQGKKQQVDVLQYGRSMIEMLGVLAIVGVLSVGGIAGYSKAMEKFKINKLIDQISHMATDVRTLYMQQSGYDYDVSTVLYDANLLPDGIKSLFGNSGSDMEIDKMHGLWIRPTYNQTDRTNAIGFSISVSVNQNFCMELATKDWGDTSQGINGIAIYTNALTTSFYVPNTDEVKNEHYYFTKNSPINVANAAEYCGKCLEGDYWSSCGITLLFK